MLKNMYIMGKIIFHLQILCLITLFSNALENCACGEKLKIHNMYILKTLFFSYM